jgi:hypothetical protein
MHERKNDQTLMKVHPHVVALAAVSNFPLTSKYGTKDAPSRSGVLEAEPKDVLPLPLHFPINSSNDI